MMNWTEKQREVIDSRDSDLLVAAAAGSGKTAVLVERIKKLILDEKKDIDRFLVVTFTRAAASEMKEKIADALIKYAEEDPASSDFMQKQLEKLGEAKICTFDSFIIDIVRQYFYIIDIEPDLAICSPEDAALISMKAIDETFERAYEENREDVIRFLDAYSSPKNDRMLKGRIIRLYNDLRAMPGGLDWLEDNISKLDMDKEGFSSGPLMQQMIRNVRNDTEKALALMEQACGLLTDSGVVKLAEKVGDELEQARMCAQAAASIDKDGTSDAEKLYDIFASLKFVQIRLTKAEKDIYLPIEDEFRGLRDTAKELLQGCRDRYFSQPFEEAVKEINATAPFASTLLYLLRMYEQINTEMKAAEGQMDFSDANHYALRILKDSEIAAEIRERFDHIFIDEYQDSNYIQEEIISAIKKDDNLFMVGDIKQSIYGFRLAEPDIFRSRYKRYAAIQAGCLKNDNGSGRKIDLNTNFRSKQSVIDSVNDIFKELMPDYDENAMLYRGDQYDGPISHKSELYIIDKKASEEDTSGITSAVDPTDTINGSDTAELRSLKNIEIEAYLVADVIKENIGRSIFDSKKNEVRKIEKKDIVILLRSAKNRADKVYDILMKQGIEAIVDDNSGYFESIEIETLTDMLRVIDNRHQDIPLLSVLRSGIFGFTIDELIKIRLASDQGDHYDAFRAYALYDSCDPVLREKVLKTISIIDDWSERSVYLSAEELVSEIISSSGYYAYAGALPGGRQRQANIRKLLEKAAEYDGKGDGTIFGFLRYLEVVRQNTDSSQAQIFDDAEDAVRIMTIHKSKGLEFPVVIVMGLGEAFKDQRIDPEGIWHKDLGFAMRYTDLDDHCYRNTLMARIISEKRARESLEEEIRVLYVACTRAKEKLIMTGCSGDVKKVQGSFLNLIEPVISTKVTDIIRCAPGNVIGIPGDNSEADRLIEENKMASGPDRNDRSMIGSMSFEDNDLNDPVSQRVGEMLSFVYPNAADLKIKSKYSVSELNAGDVPHIELKQPSFAAGRVGIVDTTAPAGKGHISGAAFGTLMHLVMERIDFHEVFSHLYQSGKEGTVCRSSAREYIEDRLRMLIQEKAVTEEEARIVRVDKIIRFFESDLGRRIATAGEVHKERQFNILHEKDGHEIIVQGIIDCYFIEQDHIILLDYKTNHNTEGIEEIYREQLALYKEALEKSTGLEVTESYLYLFSEDRAIRVEV